VVESIWWRPGTDVPRGDDEPEGRHDVVVVGAGVTGLTTALLLAESGRSVLLVEARHPGAVTTGRTTGKVSALQGTLLSRAVGAGRWPEVQAYVESTLRAQSWLRERATGLGATLEERPAVTWADDAQGDRSVAMEHQVALDLGLPVRLDQSPDLPVPARSAVVLDGQLQVDPVELVRGLVSAYLAAGGTLVTGWRMRHVRQRSGEVRVSLHSGDRTAEAVGRHVVLATGAPTVDRRMHFARVRAQRSYLLAFAVDAAPHAMGLGASSPSFSFRGARIGDAEVLLAGGGGHETGRGGPEGGSVEQLRDWVFQHWPDAEEQAVWSAQDYATTDHLPLVGSLGGASPDVHLATGFNKWGMSSGIAAALALTGRITGAPEPWADPLYDRSWRLRDVPALAGVQAGVARGGLEAVARQASSRTRSLGCGVVPICTHLGGPLRWNEVEESFDCPLHGSRFDADGEVLEGPATRRLRGRG
jgi:glycine/D-amino acid oxidase-like deaminating enzyme/nitrite reductase/ring-hydroxylating ferredoxin subunit